MAGCLFFFVFAVPGFLPADPQQVILGFIVLVLELAHTRTHTCAERPQAADVTLRRLFL